MLLSTNMDISKVEMPILAILSGQIDKVMYGVSIITAIITSVISAGYGALENIKNNTVFSKSEDTYWLCLKCGYVHFGKSAPEKCPNCHHPKAYFQVLCENY